VSAFMACWIIGYGIMQSIAPHITRANSGKLPDANTAVVWAVLLAFIPAVIALDIEIEWLLVGGLAVFGVLFAVNSSLHSYLIVSYAKAESVSLDMGFYYMANAVGRLAGTVLSGWVYQVAGLEACLWLSSGFIACAALTSTALPKQVNEI